MADAPTLVLLHVSEMAACGIQVGLLTLCVGKVKDRKDCADQVWPHALRKGPLASEAPFSNG
eukprot:scaffold209642_cov20-Tisochrysis_lutea.AAC.1